MRIIISGGGTGGHIFPAIAIANALKEMLPQASFLFVGAEGKMEMEKVPAAGYEIVGLPVAGFQRRLTFKNVTFFYKLAASLLKAHKIIKKFKPDVVIGVGGYASGPIMNAAARIGIPTLVQEQNGFPGVTNRILAQKVDKICVAYPNMEKFFPAKKIVLTGNPIRQTLLNLPTRSEAMSYFGISSDNPVLFLTGGSLGARSLNEGMMAGIEKLKVANVQVIWQTGKFYYEKVKELVENSGANNIKVYDFVSQMENAYAIADLIISRAGAGAISEIALLGKAALFVPSPNVTEDHQTKNAMALVEKEGARLVKDVEVNEKLVNEALTLLGNKSELEKLENNVKAFAYPDADKKIAKEVIQLVG